MKTFLITYDLVGYESIIDYNRLHEKIRRTFALWSRPVRSVWIVKSNMDSTQIRNELAFSMDSNDRLLVVEMTNSTAWKNLSPEVEEWLRTNLV